MFPPSTFSTLPGMFWELRKTLQARAAISTNEEQSPNVDAEATPPAPRWRSFFDIFRPALKLKAMDFRMQFRKNTIVLPGNVAPKPLPESWYGGQQPRPIFALTIGIDTYQHLPHLRGSVNDADAFAQYVKLDLKVPAECVVNLRNEDATRASILRALHALGSRSERKPRKDDAIIIYFAGYAGPWEDAFDGLQDIVPWDYNPSQDNLIPAISSQELASSLAEIKRNKGDHITLILDCGGSKSKARNALDPGAGRISSRVVTLAEAQGELKPAPLEKNVLTGNVLVLSAFSKGEAALESLGRGLFTTALIKQLKREGSANMTRANALERLPQITCQTPQAHGNASDVAFFDTGLVPPERTGYSVSIEQEHYVVHAGTVAGITQGAKFSVYRDKSRLWRKKPKTFVADRVSLFTATLKPVGDNSLKPLLNFPGAIPAGSGKRHDIVIHTVLKDSLAPLYDVALKLLYDASPEAYRFSFTEDQSKADISLDIFDDGTSLKVTVLDEALELHGYKNIPVLVPLTAKDIEIFLNTAAHFYRHLSLNINRSIGEGVVIEHLEVEESDTNYYSNGRAYRFPKGENILKQGIIEVEVDPDEPKDYGFKITNNTDQDLYPHVLYFDNSELSIANYYPGHLKPTPIRKGGGVLTIGYDNQETTSYTYFIPDGRDIDVGFIKVILSTIPIDLSTVIQNTNGQAGGGLSGHSQATQEAGGTAEDTAGGQSTGWPPESDSSVIWGSSMFCIVQRHCSPLS